MKQIIWIMALLHTVIATNGQGMKFEENLTWKQVLDKAKTENKYIFLDCFATWCGACKLMDEKVFPMENVGSFMNQHFISMKIRMDMTKNDNPSTKDQDAHQIQKQYAVNGFPTYLYFSPDGIIVQKFSGALNDTNFVNQSKLALDPEYQYSTLLEHYNGGTSTYIQLRRLARMAKIFENKELSKTVALKCIHAMNQLSEKELLTNVNLDFFDEFSNLIGLNDLFFKTFYNDPDRVDQLKFRGWANSNVNKIIKREVVYPYLQETQRPNWNKLKLIINKNYEKIDAQLLVLDEQLDYYKLRRDWIMFARYRNEKVKIYPPKSIAGAFSDVFNLNNDAWEIFMHCNDKESLNMAISWMESVIKLRGNEVDAADLDTYANLLYKIGRKQEAILREEKAMQLEEQNASKGIRKPDPVFAETLEKMKAGVKTWKE